MPKKRAGAAMAMAEKQAKAVAEKAEKASLDILFDGYLYDLMGTYVMVQLGMGIWSRWWEF
jgi:hypothetical protein